ncbi:dockerin type I domain-containing protein [Amedibacillus sp. YH-ame6]
MKKVKISLLVVIGMFLCFLYQGNLHAQEQAIKDKKNEEEISNEEIDTTFAVIEEDGSITFHESPFETYEPDYYEVVREIGTKEDVVGEYDTKEEAQKDVDTKKKARSVGDYSVRDAYNTRAGTYSVAHLKGTFYYNNLVTGLQDIFAGGSASDAAYLSTNANGTVRVKVANTVLDVPAANVSLVEYTSSTPTSHYIVTNGRLMHVYYYDNMAASASNWIGYQPSYLNANTKYYSYDGNYFYTSYTKMIDDYRSGVTTNAINARLPYYNYYEYLSHRSISNFTAADLNNYFISKKGSGLTSAMRNQGQAFINAQNKYGVNASLMYGTAINESGWGTSDYSLDRNNLFGHNAVDSNPNLATHYATLEDCIKAHAFSYISSGYLNPADYRYRGPHLGNKYAGVSSKYASDPYTGEKKAYFSYEINEYTNKNDYNKYTIGVTNEHAYVYNSTSSSKKALYSTGTNRNQALANFPMIILGKETGADGAQYYKIQSDTPLNSARTEVVANGEYDYSRDYGYILASKVSICNSGSRVLSSLGLLTSGDTVSGFTVGTDISTIASKINANSAGAFVSIKNGSGQTITSGKVGTGMKLTIKEDEETQTYDILVRGDVNGDGKISSLDYASIKNHILKIKSIQGIYNTASDVNRDGKISSLDYALVKNAILNISNIAQ